MGRSPKHHCNTDVTYRMVSTTLEPLFLGDLKFPILPAVGTTEKTCNYTFRWQ